MNLTSREEVKVAKLLERGQALKKKIQKLKWEEEDILYVFKGLDYMPGEVKKQILTLYNNQHSDAQLEFQAISRELSEMGYVLV